MSVLDTVRLLKVVKTDGQAYAFIKLPDSCVEPISQYHKKKCEDQIYIWTVPKMLLFMFCQL
jgi:hypothetical protein